jgi:hypothetical protein
MSARVNLGANEWAEPCRDIFPMCITREDPAFLLLLMLAAHPDLQPDYHKMAELSLRIPCPNYWTSCAEVDNNLYRLADLAQKLRNLSPIMGNDCVNRMSDGYYSPLGLELPEHYAQQTRDREWAASCDSVAAFEHPEWPLPNPIARATVPMLDPAFSDIHAPTSNTVESLTARLPRERRHIQADPVHLAECHYSGYSGREAFYDHWNCSDYTPEDEVGSSPSFSSRRPVLDQRPPAQIYPGLPSPWQPNSMGRPFSTISPHPSPFIATDFRRGLYYDSDSELHENHDYDEDTASVASIGGGVWMIHESP